MPKKRFLSLLLMVLFATTLSISVFAGGETEEEAKEVTVKIAFPVAVDAPVVNILNEYAEAFMKENPGITVEPVYAGGYGDVKTMIQTTIDGGGKAPSLAVMLATDLFDLVNAGYVVPMSEYLDSMKGSDTYLSDFVPAFMSNSYYMDEIYSLPFQRSAVVLYYNADLLKEIDRPVPNSWKSLAETAAAMTKKDGERVTRWGIEWPSGWPYWLFQPLAMGAGQNIVEDSDSEVYFDNQNVVDAITYYNSLSSEYEAMPAGVQASWGNVVPNFVSGNTGMIVHSSGSLSKILSQADFELGVMGIPGRKEGSEYSVPGGGNIYMIAGMDEAEKKAAFDFALFMTDASRAARFSIATGYIATRKSSLEDSEMKAYIADNPQVDDVRNVLAQAGKEFALQNLGEVRNIFHKYLQSAFNGEMSPAEAMKSAQTEADKALADFR